MEGYKCSHCGSIINDEDALLCLYCGESLRRPVGIMGRMKYSWGRIIAVVLVFLLIYFLLRVFFR